MPMSRDTEGGCTRCGGDVAPDWRGRWRNMMDQCENWPYLCQACVAAYLGEAVVETTIVRTDAWARMFKQMQHDRLVDSLRAWYCDPAHRGLSVVDLILDFPDVARDDMLAAMDVIIAERKGR